MEGQQLPQQAQQRCRQGTILLETMVCRSWQYHNQKAAGVSIEDCLACQLESSGCQRGTE